MRVLLDENLDWRLKSAFDSRQDVLPAMPEVNQVLRAIQSGEAIHVSAK
jgi:hypothetical protein